MSIEIRAEALDLPLARTFRTSRGGKDTAANVVVSVAGEGAVGIGEGAPIPRYGQSQASSVAALRDFEPPATPPFDQDGWLAAFDAAHPAETAARCALEMALWDWAGKRLGKSLADLIGLEGRTSGPSSWTISIDTPDEVEARVREASGWPVFKLKLQGGADDEEAVRRLRAATDRPFRVDANEAWDLDGAAERAAWLAAEGCELIEQPFPAGAFDTTAMLRASSPIPLVADEDVVVGVALDDLARAYDGINVKLTRLGGIREAIRWIHAARSVDLDVLMGCFVESSVGITAASHLAPMARWVDLDGAALLAADPFAGARVEDGVVHPATGAGLGVALRES